MLKTFEKYDVDAFMFPGDLGNAQNDNKDAALKQLAFFAAGVAKGNATAKVPVVWCFGNHDFVQYDLTANTSFSDRTFGFSHSFSAGDSVFDASIAILEDATATFFSADAWPAAGVAVPDGFRYNLINGFSFFGVDYTHVNTETLAFLKVQPDAVVAKSPDKQIFITSHMPSGSSSQPAGLTDLMKQYPQVVYISGHSHDTLQTYSAVVQAQGFLEFNVGPGNHGEYGVSAPAPAYNNYQMKQGGIIEVDENGRMRFNGIDYSLNQTADGFTHTLDRSYVVAENPMIIRTAYTKAPTSTTSVPYCTTA